MREAGVQRKGLSRSPCCGPCCRVVAEPVCESGSEFVKKGEKSGSD